MAVEVEKLQTALYFLGLSIEELEQIKKYITEKMAGKGEIFLLEGEWSDYLYFLISGLVKVYKTSPEGQEQILHFARPGESLNDVSTFDGGPTAASMLAITPVTLYMIRKSDFHSIVLRDHPKVSFNVIKALAHRVRRDSTLVVELSFHRVIGRLAKMLLRYAGGETGEELHLTQQDMAAAVGTTREVVNRSLRVLEDKGVIRLGRHRIEILDKEALKDLAKETPDTTVKHLEGDYQE